MIALAHMLEKLLKDLENIPEDYDSNLGMCHDFFTCLEYEDIDEMFNCWENRSGNRAYPVPVNKRATRDRKFVFIDLSRTMFHDTHNMYDKSTEYGRLRWKLLKHCVEYITKELAGRTA